MSMQVADIVVDRINKQFYNLGLPTGKTPIKLYEILVKKEIDWSNVKTFNLDEYLGVPSNHPLLFKNFMFEHFHKHINIKEENIYFPTRDYEEVIERNGNLDLTILGLGTNAHIAFNEPGSEFNSISRTVMLDESTKNSLIKDFGNYWLTPRIALTMGIQTILNSKEIILLVCGRNKLDILQQSLWKEPTIYRPCSALQLHKNVSVFYCDY